ncbi:hypothetical protein, partial [Streptococcus hyointestinalis]|uniref:hypothetical protein n=1 Tax=Streptococcus hyointestinalis TaxID=1337 RepID=UPI003F9B85C9
TGEKKRFSLGVFSVPCFLKKQLEFSQLSIDFLPLDLNIIKTTLPGVKLSKQCGCGCSLP